MIDTPKQLFIGGTWADAADGATMPVDDPATGEILCHVADAGRQGRPARRGRGRRGPGGVGRARRPGRAARSCAGRTRSSSSAPTSSPC